VTVAGGKRVAPTSPGEMLREEFLKPMGLINYRLGESCMAREATCSSTAMRPPGCPRKSCCGSRGS
jgi:hypothetical protein